MFALVIGFATSIGHVADVSYGLSLTVSRCLVLVFLLVIGFAMSIGHVTDVSYGFSLTVSMCLVLVFSELSQQLD